jgi:hypothetical protein
MSTQDIYRELENLKEKFMLREIEDSKVQEEQSIDISNLQIEQGKMRTDMDQLKVEL